MDKKISKYHYFYNLGHLIFFFLTLVYCKILFSFNYCCLSSSCQ